MPTNEERPLAPVRGAERLAAVDVLRGFALLGILAMNIYAFALPWPAYTDPNKGGGTGVLDIGTWWFTHLFVDMKFMSLFSMLFGAGLALMARRATAGGGRFGAIYYRRMLWLLLVGLLHGYLLWFGDILYGYAICGLVLYPLRRLRPRTLLPLGAALLSVTVPVGLAFGHIKLPMMKAEAASALAAQQAGETLTDEQREIIETWSDFAPSAKTLREEIETYRGGYLQQVIHRAPLVLQFQTVFLIFFGFWRISGLMLIGMGLMKLDVFSAARSTRFYASCCAIGYGVGLPLVLLGARGLMAHEFDVLYSNQGGYLPNYYGSILVALGHVGLVMLVYRSGVLRGLAARLAAVGRIALTNYLSHTLICTTIFYGWGLGLFARIGRFGLLGVVVAIWLFQLWLSPLWLRHFRFGPAEWLWRSLTYWRAQSMRVELPAEDAS